MSIELYTKPMCNYCTKAKALLTQKKIPYTEFVLGNNIVKEDIQRRITSMGISTEVKTVPQIFYTDKAGTVHYIGGYSELVARQAILGT